ncbi:MAG TPA: aldehyde dehydrogenase family protein, partial [Thermopetrobacter sp.]|nr:aldehyde dehydrogenase family protein [Thermopetrobacter sp.]
MDAPVARQLKDVSLIKDACLIGGEWVTADGWMEVRDPATGEVIARVPDCGAAHTERAIAAAVQAQKAWARLMAKERAAVLKRWHGLILEHAEDLALIMTREQGKPLAEARGEVTYGAGFIEWAAEETKRLYGEVVPSPFDDARIMVLRQPVGVVAAITPWNFPNAMITRKAGPALAAGCAVVLKPAEDTPLSALALGELAMRAGLPPGLFNIVTGQPEEIGRTLSASDDVRMLTFTGSTEVGKLLMRQCADTVKKVALELGGNAPFIVFDDADLDMAAEGALASKYRNTGQTCV